MTGFYSGFFLPGYFACAVHHWQLPFSLARQLGHALARYRASPILSSGGSGFLATPGSTPRLFLVSESRGPGPIAHVWTLACLGVGAVRICASGKVGSAGKGGRGSFAVAASAIHKLPPATCPSAVCCWFFLPCRSVWAQSLQPLILHRPHQGTGADRLQKIKHKSTVIG